MGPTVRSWRFLEALALSGLLVLPAACNGGGGQATPARLLQSGEIETWAGNGQAGFNGDGMALTASRMYWPIDIIFTQAGRPYVLDWNNHRIREVTTQGTFKTVVGTDFVGDGALSGPNDLTAPGVLGTEVNLNHPTQMLELPSGDILFAAWHNLKLRRYTPSTGNVVVVAGNLPGFAGDGAVASAGSKFNQVAGVARATDGTIYILDQRNQRIRKIEPVAGVLGTVAGAPTAPPPGGLSPAEFGGDGGPPASAKFGFPTGSNPLPGGSLALDSAGRLYVPDRLNHRIRRIDFTNNLIETVAGNASATGLDKGGFGGDGGPATAALLNMPRDVEIHDGRLYIADSGNNRVRAVDLITGIIETVAGNGQAGFSGDGGTAVAASLDNPMGVAFDGAGDMYISDSNNNRIRRVRK